MTFSKILYFDDMVNREACLCVEFHGRRPNSLLGVESQRNHKSGFIRASLAALNYYGWYSINFVFEIRIFALNMLAELNSRVYAFYLGSIVDNFMWQ